MSITPIKAIYATAILVALIGTSVAISTTHKTPLVPTSGGGVVTVQTVAVTHPTTPEVFTDVNNERVKAGLPALVDDSRLDASAAAKCNDMVTYNYWSHYSPTDVSPWFWIKAQGVSYKTAGENLEFGSSGSQSVVDSWMNSPEHKANILNTTYTYEGLAVCHSDNYVTHGSSDIIVQHFVGL